MRNHVPFICAVLSACLAGCALDGAAVDQASSGLTTNASVQLWYDWTFGTATKGLSLKTGKNLANTASASSRAVVVRPDHRVAVAGRVLQSGQGTYCPIVAQFTSSGVLDTSFGTGGIATVSLCTSNTQINAAVLQPDGKLVVAGRYNNGFLLLRLLANGAVDYSFGFFGLVSTSFSGVDWVNTLALQPDGKIVAGGALYHLARYNADGTLDASFGTAGWVYPTLPTAGIALQPDGKIVALSAPNELIVRRFTAGGAVDPTFGQGGSTTLPVNGGGASVVIRADGKIVIGGFHDAIINGSTYETGLVARLLPTGTLDTTFNGTGLVDLNSPGHNHRQVVSARSLPDGSVVTAGWDNSWTGDNVELVMAHVFDDGTLDPNFGITQTFMQSDFSPLATVVEPQAMVLDSLPTQTRVVLAANNRGNDINGNPITPQIGVARLVFVAAP